jgi:hypothetical protein
MYKRKMEIVKQHKNDTGTDIPNVVMRNCKLRFDEIQDYHGKEFVNICKKIRRYAIAGRFKISTENYNSDKVRKIDLFKMIEACGVDVEMFVSEYLSVLQPYCLHQFKTDEENIWICDMGYNYQMVIRLNVCDKENPMIVSFHESNDRIKKSYFDKPCAVFVEHAQGIDAEYLVDYIIHDGFIKTDISTFTSAYKDSIALVDYWQIENYKSANINQFLKQIAELLSDDEYLEEQNPVVLGKKEFGCMSFLSYGYNHVNNICMLIDLYSLYKDKMSFSILAELTDGILSNMSENEIEKLQIKLKSQYDNKKNKLYEAISWNKVELG